MSRSNSRCLSVLQNNNQWIHPCKPSSHCFQHGRSTSFWSGSWENLRDCFLLCHQYHANDSLCYTEYDLLRYNGFPCTSVVQRRTRKSISMWSWLFKRTLWNSYDFCLCWRSLPELLWSLSLWEEIHSLVLHVGNLCNYPWIFFHRTFLWAYCRPAD